MFKKRSVAGQLRSKRQKEDDDGDDARTTHKHKGESDEEDQVIIVKPERRDRTLPSLVQSVKSSAPSRKTIMEERSFTASGTAASLIPQDMGATAITEIDTERERDSLAVAQRALEINQELTGLADDKIYRGLAGYTQYYTTKDIETGTSTSSRIKIGPLRASSNIRVTSRFDYQPDVCKDYKETGYCGYGDSCKFLHDRGDYKSGWQIERDWNKQQKEVQESQLLTESDDETVLARQNDIDDDLPFACLICRKEFVRPVVTKCKHYFCESCAIKNFSKSSKCFACGAATSGIFSPAKEIIEKLERKQRVKPKTDEGE